MKVLIDGDIVAYRCAASVQDYESIEICYHRITELINQIMYNTSADSHEVWLSGPDNFRYKIYPEYKANRKDMKRPAHLEDCKAFLVTAFDAKLPTIWEADDMLGYYQSNDTVIATIDKDLLMVPGKHHNWVKAIDREVTPLDGLKHFYKQMLIGDRSDNIIGVNKIGEVKAGRIIDPLENEQDMLEGVFQLYEEDAIRFLINASCLWINQGEEQQFWTTHVKSVGLILPDQLKQEVEQMSDFTTSLMAAT